MTLIQFVFLITILISGWWTGHALGREIDWKAMGFQTLVIAMYILLLYIAYKSSAGVTL